MSLAASELILNTTGSIYHLDLLPEDLADTVILVGDPDRVSRVSRHFDSLELKKQKREFRTHTGMYKGKRLSVISTGIGTDNIDIVINELDALVNIDLKTRSIREQKRSLNIIRIGTSGAIQPEIPVDSFVRSDKAVGFDSLLHYYQIGKKEFEELENCLASHLQLSADLGKPYITAANPSLASLFLGQEIMVGFTGTNVGFYGPQGRVLRLPLKDPLLNKKLESFRYHGEKITNLEMETAGIYGLCLSLIHI